MMAFLFIPIFFLTLILTMLWCRYKDGRWDARQFIASGGMPSSHSATVIALAVAVGIQEGFRSATFATALVFACVVRTLLKLFIHYLIVCLLFV
jgi:acid phosphatase family membrane protein YuiD